MTWQTVVATLTAILLAIFFLILLVLAIKSAIAAGKHGDIREAAGYLGASIICILIPVFATAAIFGPMREFIRSLGIAI